MSRPISVHVAHCLASHFVPFIGSAAATTKTTTTTPTPTPTTTTPTRSMTTPTLISTETWSKKEEHFWCFVKFGGVAGLKKSWACRQPRSAWCFSPKRNRFMSLKRLAFFSYLCPNSTASKTPTEGG